LYAVLLIAGVQGVRRNRWAPFYVAVAGAALIKPPFLALLLLPLLLGTRQLASSLSTVALTAGTMLLEALLWPAQFKAFLRAVAYQVVTLNDSGYGLVRYLDRAGLHGAFAYIGHAALMLGLVLALWGARRRYRHAVHEGIWFAAVIVVTVLANPRLQHYDTDVAIVPATLIVVESIAWLRRSVRPLSLALPVAAYAVLLTRTPMAALYCLLLGSVLLVLGSCRLAKRS
jgi:hypothetical protein